MGTMPGGWSVAGLVAGGAGLATSYLAAAVLTVRDGPLVAVAELAIRLTPGPVVDLVLGEVGSLGKPLLLTGLLVVLAACFAWAGRRARRAWWQALAILVLLAVVGVVAMALQRGATAIDQVPVAVGLGTWVAALAYFERSLRRLEAAPDDHHMAQDTGRRSFLLRAAAVAGAAALVAGAGRFAGTGRRRVEEARRMLRLDKVTPPRVPAGAHPAVEGLGPWRTPNAEFYRVDTAVVVPSIDPAQWRLRIHGMVDRDITVDFEDLLSRRFTEAWVTLTCVSNPVGGDLAGNAWWSGVRVAELLAEAGVQPGADAVLQTSQDGWNCGTPLSALTDDRNALLAVGMNGQALPLEHGFPVRMVVPGLYGYVSATKWVVDLEVTTFEKISAYWTQRGWAEQAPVKLASRVDVPRDGAEVPAGELTVAGVAWAQHVGVSAVEVAVDGGPWQPARLGTVPGADTWVQWVATVTVEPGDHTMKVRATDARGNVQTPAIRGVLPDGATGWHNVEFSATSEEQDAE